MGTMTREGVGCGDGDVDGTVVDAEQDGEAYGGDLDDAGDWTSGNDTLGEDRFDAGLAGHIVLALVFTRKPFISETVAVRLRLWITRKVET